MTKTYLHKGLDRLLSIDRFVHDTLRSGGGDEELLARAFDYMPIFKQLLDTTTHEQMDQLCTTYSGFYRFAKLLEQLNASSEKLRKGYTFWRSLSS